MPISKYLGALRAKIGHDLVLTPGVTAVVMNEQGEVLLHQSSDNGNWYLIGGGMDPGEQPAEAVAREVLEETGLEVIPERIIGVYADEPVLYPNGDVTQYVSTSFFCRPVGGRLHVADDESLDVRYFSPADLPAGLAPRHRLRIEHALSGDPAAKFLRKNHS